MDITNADAIIEHSSNLVHSTGIASSPLLDVILVILLAGFVLFGLWFGFVHTLGSLIGTFAGAFFAGVFHAPLGKYFETIFGHPNLSKIIAFTIIFILINRIIGFIFYLIEKATSFITKIPGLKAINRLLGAIVGLVEGVFVIGLVIFVMSKYPVADWFTNMLANSNLVPWFMKTSKILQIVLPDMLKQLQSVIMGG